MDARPSLARHLLAHAKGVTCGMDAGAAFACGCKWRDRRSERESLSAFKTCQGLSTFYWAFTSSSLGWYRLCIFFKSLIVMRV